MKKHTFWLLGICIHIHISYVYLLSSCHLDLQDNWILKTRRQRERERQRKINIYVYIHKMYMSIRDIYVRDSFTNFFPQQRYILGISAQKIGSGAGGSRFRDAIWGNETRNLGGSFSRFCNGRLFGVREKIRPIWQNPQNCTLLPLRTLTTCNTSSGCYWELGVRNPVLPTFNSCQPTPWPILARNKGLTASH